MAWKLDQCNWCDRAQLDAYLRESWEPFAVTETDHAPTIWLRRSADPEDARVVDMPRRPRGEPELA
jgi:hypothetical protein